jgi:hypothetical protein
MAHKLNDIGVGVYSAVLSVADVYDASPALFKLRIYCFENFPEPFDVIFVAHFISTKVVAGKVYIIFGACYYKINAVILELRN